MHEAEKLLSENIFPLNIRGDQGNPGVAPCIIKEVYFPPESPQEVATLIESALVYQCSSNFEMAIDCYEKAKATWMAIIKQRDSAAKTLKRPEQELFFHLSIGSVHESAGKDDLALASYKSAKEVAEILPGTHPDRAFSYCGLGSVLYHMEEPAYALRLYL